ncbi:MAG: histidine kinase, partial [Caldilineaceae bacterium]
EALDLARERNVPSTEGLIQHNLGEAYMALGNPHAAIEHLLLCAARKQALNERSELARCHLYLSEAHEQAGNPAKALEHFRIHHTLHEQVAGERADMRLKVLHVAHETNAAHARAQAATERADELAREVHNRTAELQSTVAQLQSEMDQRTRIQKELHRTLASLEHRLADRTEELAAFFDLTLLGSRGVDLAEVLELILPRILEVTRSRAVCIHQLDAESACLRLVGEQNVPQNLRGPLLEISLEPDFLEWLQQPNDPVASTALSVLTTIPRPLRLPGFATYLGVQVRSGAQPLGILSCYRFTNRGFGVDEIALVAALAEQTSLLFETNRLRGEVQAKAVLEERHRLARDLHDSVTQSLYSLSLLSRAAREALRAGDTQHLDDCLTELERDTLHALREMRLLLYELRPANLESAGLVAALEFRLDTVERRAGLQIE